MPRRLDRRTLLIALTAWPVMARADAPKPGLAWNRTGLPLVFPLHVLTEPGHSYFVKLREAESGKDALAAHFVGGNLFRVLCPPGDYRIAIARGQRWQDEDHLFGPETEIVDYPEPLTFETVGLRTRRGWLLDLRDFDQPRIDV